MNNPLAIAAQWIQSLLTGSIAVSLAILAVAFLGFAMLQGRLDWRRGGLVVIGCFIIFAAGGIAQGLVFGLEPPENSSIIDDVAPAYRASRPNPQPYDPYDGAAVPNQSDKNPLD